jgi:acyl-CoA synthetase (AMP-forming)/AMP-acid ligase II
LVDAATGAEIASHRGELRELRRILSMEPADPQSDWRRLIDTHAGQKPPPLALDPFAPAAIGYTSGTTGFPKGAVHSQHNMMVVAASGIGEASLRHGCTMQLTILNVMINHGLTLLARGGTVVCVDRLDASGIVEWIERESLEGFRAPPAIVYDLLTKPELQEANLSRLKYVGVGGAAPSEKLRKLYEVKFGHNVGGAYGLTEAPAAATKLEPDEPPQADAIGRALPHLDIRILDADDREVAPGEPGEICVRAVTHGPWAGVYTPMLGYWRQRQATRSTLHAGWLHTGDIGHMDPTGMVFIRGRSKEMILRGGANVYPAEVERVLLHDTRVREAIVLGVPDDRLGEAVVAVIESHGIVDTANLTADLMARATAELARYKRPDHYVVRPELPRNAMGKVERHKLRQEVLMASRRHDAEEGGKP